MVTVERRRETKYFIESSLEVVIDIKSFGDNLFTSLIGLTNLIHHLLSIFEKTTYLVGLTNLIHHLLIILEKTNSK